MEVHILYPMNIVILNFCPVTLNSTFYLFDGLPTLFLPRICRFLSLFLPIEHLRPICIIIIISHLGTSSSLIYITQNINHVLLAEDLLFKTPMIRHITYENYANCDKLAAINNGPRVLLSVRLYFLYFITFLSSHRNLLNTTETKNSPFSSIDRAVYRNFAKGPIWGMEKRGGAEARHLGGSGGMLLRENFVIFSAFSFHLVQTAAGRKIVYRWSAFWRLFL